MVWQLRVACCCFAHATTSAVLMLCSACCSVMLLRTLQQCCAYTSLCPGSAPRGGAKEPPRPRSRQQAAQREEGPCGGRGSAGAAADARPASREGRERGDRLGGSKRRRTPEQRGQGSAGRARPGSQSAGGSPLVGLGMLESPPPSPPRHSAAAAAATGAAPPAPPLPPPPLVKSPDISARWGEGWRRGVGRGEDARCCLAVLGVHPAMPALRLPATLQQAHPAAPQWQPQATGSAVRAAPSPPKPIHTPTHPPPPPHRPPPRRPPLPQHCLAGLHLWR